MTHLSTFDYSPKMMTRRLNLCSYCVIRLNDLTWWKWGFKKNEHLFWLMGIMLPLRFCPTLVRAKDDGQETTFSFNFLPDSSSCQLYSQLNVHPYQTGTNTWVLHQPVHLHTRVCSSELRASCFCSDDEATVWTTPTKCSTLQSIRTALEC